MGLRETKKARQRAEILESSLMLFRERGYEATRVRDVANRTAISEATFFNYFPTKEAVLGRWVDEQFAAAATASPGGGTGAGTRQRAHQIVRALATGLAADPELTRLAWTRARWAPAASLPGESRWSELLFAAGQARDEVRGDLSPGRLGSLLEGVLHVAVGDWLRSGANAPSLESQLRQAADVFLDGCRKRHERVASARPR
ncbi:MAG: TetR/AcrR family transcriptional regulator [Proteobacteria bacterium]|nr:TetR/AcrR family transcriptional regulator [Pseudomonadota bacterium]